MNWHYASSIFDSEYIREFESKNRNLKTVSFPLLFWKERGMRRKGEIAIKRERMEEGEAESKWVGAGEAQEERWERRMRNRRWEGGTDVRSSLQKERAGEGGHKEDGEKRGKNVRKELWKGREGEGNVIKKARER
jgi:hypothetical protein